MTNQYVLQKTGQLPKAVAESSGLAFATNRNTYWTMNDSGSGNELFKITEKGELLSTIVVQNSKNIDWEDLSSDPQGNIYIGDVGNNARSRKDQVIYIADSSLTLQQKIAIQFPVLDDNPSGQEDCEAFFYWNNEIYLFSKASQISQGVSRLYKVSAKEGHHTAVFIDKIRLDGQITSADIRSDGKQMALMTYGKLLLFDIKPDAIDFKNPMGCLKVVRKQTEALMYVDHDQWLLTNEQRNIFRVKAKRK